MHLLHYYDALMYSFYMFTYLRNLNVNCKNGAETLKMHKCPVNNNLKNTYLQ